MALRFMQIFIPETSPDEIDRLLDGKELLGTFRDTAHEDRLVLQMLLPAEETEPVMDRFEQQFGGDDGFCVVLLPIEGTLPRPQQQTEEEEPAEEMANSVTESGSVGREELYNEVSDATGINRVLVALTALSSIVAAVGLLRDDVAVIIGAMVIAPLLGPNVAMSLAATLGDSTLFRQALLTNVVCLAVALGSSMVVGFFFEVDAELPAIAARSQVNFADIALALAAGAAGTFAFTRGMIGAITGVMVAVALVPPLVAFGMLLGSGQFELAVGALLLVATNVVCINLAGVATFVSQGVRPHTWLEEAQAKRSTRIAIATWLGLLAALAALLYITQK